MNTFTKTFLATALVFAAPSLAAAQACPSYENSGAPLSYSSEDVYAPQSLSVVAGGDLDLSQCSELPGFGHVIASPDFTLQYDSLEMGRALEFRVTGECDTVLLINTSEGAWLFNDDDSGVDPRVRIAAAPDGQYDIWVGTLEAATCAATLTIESF